MEDKVEIGLLLGWIVMALLVTVIIFFSQNYRTKILKSEKEKQLEAFKASIEAVEKEKESIAKNLHDEIIPLLTALGQNNRQHIKNFNDTSVNLKDFENDSAIISQSINSMRAIALGLIPATFLNFGLLKALEQFVNQLTGKGSLVEIHISDSLEKELPFSKNEQINIYRMCVEILNNLQKHAYFNFLNISVTNVGRNYIFQFAHDGKGVTNADIAIYETKSTGFGLHSLKTRALILNATIDYKITEDGTIPVVTLIVPYNS